MNIENFDWGWMNGNTNLAIHHKRGITQEVFIDRAYEKVRLVKPGDIVLDIGASTGPFTYSILDKNPSKVICVEPSTIELPILEKNVKRSNVEIIPKGIGDENGFIYTKEVFGANDQSIQIPTTTFSSLIKDNNLDKINFLKTDCEGGEYFIFNLENLFWIKDNVDFIVGEWHLSDKLHKQKFRNFRDTYLKLFPNHHVYSTDGVDIKWDLWNENFIEYYNQVIIHISNE